MAISALRRRLGGIWYPGAGAAAPPLPLRAAAALYGPAAAWHGRRGAREARGRGRLPVPCVAVGNLTVGGSGKTPLVAWIVEELLAAGARPGVVSRGYGGSQRGPVRVPASGGAAAAACGDEPALLAARFPGVPVVVGADRVAAGRLAVREGAGVVVADDAFQHRRLARDLDVVVVDALDGFGNGRLLPAGPLREPVAALARAGVVVLRGPAAAGAHLEALIARLAPHVALVRADLRFAGWRGALSGAPAALPAGSAVAGFAGIASPGRFRTTLEELGLRLTAWEEFPDHHAYTPAELRRIAAAADAAGVPAVTTAKDAVRVAAWPGRGPLFRAEVKLAIIQGYEKLWGALTKSTAAARG